VGSESRGPSCRQGGILLGGFSIPDWTLWLPVAYLTCPLLNGSISGGGIQSGAPGGLPLPRGIREQAVPKPRITELKSAGVKAVPEAAMTEQGRVGDPSPAVISSHFETLQPRLVRDLSGEWSRFGVFCLGLSRFRPLGPGSRWPVEDGLRSVSALFSRANPSGAPKPSLPTLKTGNGESRSWVQIPPHPLG